MTGHASRWFRHRSCPVAAATVAPAQDRQRTRRIADGRMIGESRGQVDRRGASAGHAERPLMRWTFPRHLRLRRQADFDRVYQRRMVAADRMIVVHADANSLPHPRLGLSVSRKAGSAVVRNRWKRLIREAFRLSQHELPRGVDLVVRPQAGAEPSLETIRRSLTELAWRLARRLHRPRPTPPSDPEIGESASRPTPHRGREPQRSRGSRPRP